MKYRFVISSIPVFKFIPPEPLNALGKESRSVVLEPNAILVKQGQKMPGLFLVLEGEVEVYSGDFEEYITTLRKGASIGEMSLIDDSGASASLRAGPEGAKLFVCPRKAFEEIVQSKEEISNLFFKGVALLLAYRLRKTNHIISEKIGHVKTSLKEMLHLTEVKELQNFGELNLKIKNMISSLECVHRTICDDDKTEEDSLENSQTKPAA